MVVHVLSPTGFDDHESERCVGAVRERHEQARRRRRLLSRLRARVWPRAARSTRTLGVAAFFRNNSNLSQRPEKCMKVQQALLLGTVVGGMVAIGVVTAAQPETDPVELLATVRRRFENNHIRVLEFRARPARRNRCTPILQASSMYSLIRRCVLPCLTAQLPRRA